MKLTPGARLKLRIDPSFLSTGRIPLCWCWISARCKSSIFRVRRSALPPKPVVTPKDKTYERLRTKSTQKIVRYLFRIILTIERMTVRKTSSQKFHALVETLDSGSFVFKPCLRAMSSIQLLASSLRQSCKSENQDNMTSSNSSSMEIRSSNLLLGDFDN